VAPRLVLEAVPKAADSFVTVGNQFSRGASLVLNDNQRKRSQEMRTSKFKGIHVLVAAAIAGWL
jgi:hypothetical protein